MSKGAVIIGYPAIGKSSISGAENGIIDLESSHFHGAENKDEKWWIKYCEVAESLAEQGYIVFVSSHSNVVETLHMTSYNLETPVFIICPAIQLKDKWLERLEYRYERTGLEKDKMALDRAKEYFEDDIIDLSENTAFKCFNIIGMDYDLNDFIEHLKEIYLS